MPWANFPVMGRPPSAAWRWRVMSFAALCGIVGASVWLASCVSQPRGHRRAEGQVSRPTGRYRVPRRAGENHGQSPSPGKTRQERFTSSRTPATTRRRNARRTPVEGPKLASITSPPTIRVRIERQLHEVRITADAAIDLGPTGSDFRDHAQRFYSPVVIRREPSGFIIAGADGRAIRWALDDLRILAAGGAEDRLTLNAQPFPGRLVLNTLATQASRPYRAQPRQQTHQRRRSRQPSQTHQPRQSPGNSPRHGADPPGRFDVINHVSMERYLPGVLEKELYAKWPAATYRAQAIAARSYALWERRLQRQRHPERDFDLEASEASQVYAGHSTRPKAVAAVRQTRGLVLGYHGRVVPGFFSSACGGRGQDAAAAFPDRAPDIVPLGGRGHGRWCQGSDKYRWGPVRREVRRLSQRIRAWGLANDDAVKRLGRLRQITVTDRSASGRPTSFTLTDTRGQSVQLRAEAFRRACNFHMNGSPTLRPGKRIYSSDVRLTLHGSTADFTNGRGFGHGVGLCQWGARALAQAGYNAAQICRFYYPRQRLAKLY